jgi:hypothetical protein
MPLTKIEYAMIADEAKQILTESSADVIAAKNIGYLEAGDTVPTGTSLQEFIELLLTSQFYPTFTEPSAGLSSATPYSREIGSKLTPTLTASYTAGSVSGTMSNGVWLPNSVQSAVWTGSVTKYSFSGTGITGTADNGTTAAYTVGAEQTIGDSGLTYTVSINYAAGTYVAVNSAGASTDANGNNYVVHPSGAVTATVSFTGFRNMFYGVSSSSSDVPTNNATATSIVRALASTKSSPANGNTFTLSPVVGTRRVMFAYPSTLRDVTSVIDSGTGYNVKDSFTKTVFNVEGANGFTGIAYKIYSFVPPSPFSQATTYSVTI